MVVVAAANSGIVFLVLLIRLMLLIAVAIIGGDFVDINKNESTTTIIWILETIMTDNTKQKMMDGTAEHDSSSCDDLLWLCRFRPRRCGGWSIVIIDNEANIVPFVSIWYWSFSVFVSFSSKCLGTRQIKFVLTILR